MRRFREPTLSDALTQEIEQFLCALQSEGGDDDVSSAFESFGYCLIKLIDGWAQLLVQSVTVCGFHHDVFGVWRLRGAAQQQATGVAQVARKQHTGRMALFLELQENAGRAQDVASVDEGSVHAGGDLKDLCVDRGPSEIIEAVQCVEGRIERFLFVVACTVVPDPCVHGSARLPPACGPHPA